MTDNAALKQLSEVFDDFVDPQDIVEASGGKIDAKTMAWWIRDKNRNGLAEHVRRSGRNYLVSARGFTRWWLGRQGKYV